MIYILSICIVTSILGFIYFIKYKNLKTKVSDTIKQIEKPLRSGYYIEHCTQSIRNSGTEIEYKGMVFVNEIDRFKNGESKISFNKLEFTCDSGSFTPESAEKFIRGKFVSVVKTSSITWLESDQSAKYNYNFSVDDNFDLKTFMCKENILEASLTYPSTNKILPNGVGVSGESGVTCHYDVGGDKEKPFVHIRLDRKEKLDKINGN